MFTRVKKYSNPTQVMPATKMDPAQDHQDGGFPAGKVDLWRGPQPHKWNEHLASKVQH